MDRNVGCRAACETAASAATPAFAGMNMIRAAHAEIAPDGIDAEFKKLFYDTANAFYAPTIAALTTYVPETQIVFGTDYPFRPCAETVSGLAESEFSADDMRAIDRDNALRLMPQLRTRQPTIA